MHRSLFAPLLAATGILVCILFYLAYLDDIAGQRSLHILSSAVSYLSEVVRPAILDLHFYIAWGTAAALASIFLMGGLSRSLSHILFFMGVAAALATQFILVDEKTRMTVLSLLGRSPTSEGSIQVAIWSGVVGYTAAFLLLFRAHAHPTSVGFDEVQSRTQRFGAGAFLLLFFVVVVGSLFRTYGLNHHLNLFEGELAPYSAGGTSLSGMIYANRGYNGPWAPLGLLYYLPIYITTYFCGTTLLALRLSSALVGIATIPLVFLLANRIAGRAAGMFAAALFALNCLHIGWSRTDIHPHGVTTWPTLLMCLFLLRAAETKSLVWALGVAFMMGLSWHQYPSGQSAVAIPLLAVGFYFLANRGKLPLRRWQLCILALGVVLWILGLPLSYFPVDGQFKFLNPFTLTGPRALWGSEEPTAGMLHKALFVLLQTGSHVWDFAQGVFFKVPYLFHQEWLPYTPPLFSRSVPWFVVSLAMTAVALLLAHRKRFETAVLLGWFIAALLPGVLSSHAYPKRLSTVFPLIDILAGIAVGFGFEYLRRSGFRISRLLGASLAVASLVSLSLYGNFVWFSKAYFRYGEPPEVAMARDLERAIPPKTLVIAGLGGGYEPGKFLYLMLDHLTASANRPNLFVLVSNSGLLSIVSQRSLDTDQVAISLPYTWTKLDRQLSESLSNTDWENVTFIVLKSIHNNISNAEALSLAQAMCASPIVSEVHSAVNTPEWEHLTITSVTCKVTDLVQSLTLMPSKLTVGGGKG